MYLNDRKITYNSVIFNFMSVIISLICENFSKIFLEKDKNNFN